MSISIITPTLNSAYKLKHTLQSLEQLESCYEHIIIDAISSDNTKEVCKSYKNKLLFISEHDEGISDAFNKGIRYAGNDYILILNAGDALNKNIFDIYMQSINENPDVDIFYGDVEYVSQDGNLHYTVKPNISNIWKYMSVYHPGMLIRKSAYNKIGGYNHNYNYAMDSEWVHRAIVNNLRFKYLPDVLASMELGGKSDKYYYRSLLEFLLSSIKYGPSKTMPIYYFFRQLILHTLLKIPSVKNWRLQKRAN